MSCPPRWPVDALTFAPPLRPLCAPLRWGRERGAYLSASGGDARSAPHPARERHRPAREYRDEPAHARRHPDRPDGHGGPTIPGRPDAGTAAGPPTATTPAQVSGSSSPSAVAVVLPADTTWTTVVGVALPVSATAGPLRCDHSLTAGFAHTPAGAVLAGVRLLVNTTPQVG